MESDAEERYRAQRGRPKGSKTKTIYGKFGQMFTKVFVVLLTEEKTISALSLAQRLDYPISTIQRYVRRIREEFTITHTMPRFDTTTFQLVRVLVRMRPGAPELKDSLFEKKIREVRGVYGFQKYEQVIEKVYAVDVVNQSEYIEGLKNFLQSVGMQDDVLETFFIKSNYSPIEENLKEIISDLKPIIVDTPHHSQALGVQEVESDEGKELN